MRPLCRQQRQGINSLDSQIVLVDAVEHGAASGDRSRGRGSSQKARDECGGRFSKEVVIIS